MAVKSFTPEDVTEAVNLIGRARSVLLMSLKARGFVDGFVLVNPDGFFVWPHGTNGDPLAGVTGGTFREALSAIELLPLPVKWTPELIEATLYAGEAA